MKSTYGSSWSFAITMGLAGYNLHGLGLAVPLGFSALTFGLMLKEIVDAIRGNR